MKKIILLTSLFLYSIGFSQNLESKLDAYLKPYLEMDAWSGVILVSDSGRPLLAKGFGEANREWGIQNSVDGKFRIASISKLFTEVAILKLADRKKLSLDDKLSQFILGYPRGDEITVSNLINHTSGIPHLNNYLNYDDLIKFDYSLLEVIDLFKFKDLDFQPGTKYNYSNSGYVLLAFIIEKLSGLTYQKYLQKHILQPLNLMNTGIDDTKTILEKRVNGYQFNEFGDLINSDYVNMDIKIGGGSLYSTATDVSKFVRAVSNRDIIKENLDQLTNFSQKNGESIFSANGRVQGFCHQVTHWINEDLTIVVLGNNYSNIALPISDDVYKIYKGEPYEIPKNYLTLEKKIKGEQLKAYEGTYDFGFGPIGEVLVVDDNLTFRGKGKSKRDALVPIGNDTFFYKQSWVILRFTDKNKNEFKTLEWVMGENAYPARKI